MRERAKIMIKSLREENLKLFRKAACHGIQITIKRLIMKGMRNLSHGEKVGSIKYNKKLGKATMFYKFLLLIFFLLIFY